MAVWSGLQRLALVFSALLCGSQVLSQLCRSDRTVRGTAGGAACAFPFIYRNSHYSECTTIDNNGIPWCATTSNYDSDEKWGACVCDLSAPEAPCKEKTVNGNSCARPFYYKGRAYYGCSTFENNGVLWCSLDTVYQNRWENCAGTVCAVPGCRVDVTDGGNAGGSSCSIPFTYKGNTYSACTDADNNGVKWCSATPNYDADPRWGRCICDLVTPAPSAGTLYCRESPTALGNAGGSGCVFPFVYRGVSYSECTVADNNGRKWCATTSDYDRDQRWGQCICDLVGTPKPTFVPLFCSTDRTTGGNNNGRPCSFPFLYKSVIYNSCTMIDNKNTPWCATTGNYDVDQLWGNCVCDQITTQSPTVSLTPCRTDVTEVGNSGGAPCFFPFVYKQRTYTSCTAADNNRVRWCATTPDYDIDQRWGRCICDESLRPTPAPPPRTGCILSSTSGGNGGGAPCRLPYVYQGNTYTDCNNQNNNNRYWCAVTQNYDIDRLWGNCNCNPTAAPTVGPPGAVTPTNAPAPACTDRTVDGRPCSLPFFYRGVFYNGCINLNNMNTFWCSLTPNYESDMQWGNCQLPICNVATPAPSVTSNVKGCRGDVTFAGNGGDRACTFPFFYKGLPYSECITLDHTRQWCAVTRDYDIEKAWGNCICGLPTMATVPVFVGQCRADVTQAGNANGAACVLPFIYKGISYNECTLADNPRLWCATTSNYDVTPKWGQCICATTATTTFAPVTFAPALTPQTAAPTPTPFNCRVDVTTGGNGGGSRCIFPFQYNRQFYTSCIIILSDQPWCAVTQNYDRDRLWGNCLCAGFPGRETPAPLTTPTTPGDGGVLTTPTTTTQRPIQPTPGPAITPTTTEGGTTPLRPPAGTTPFRCREFTTTNEVCSATFIYNNVQYNGCTMVDFPNTFWCSTDPVYIGNYGVCQLPLRCSGSPAPSPSPTPAPAPPPPPPPSGQCVVFTINGQCNFPFSYNGVDFNNCTNVDNGNTLWCSLTRNYNRDGRLGLCTDFSRCRG